MPKTPDLIKDRDKRTAKRKLDKKALDEMIDLAVDTGPESIRLLDEGFITFSDGTPYFYIKKGTLAALVANMKDEYVGSINLGHMDFARFPFLLGTWTKKDLTLVDIGDGRMGLDVKPHFDNDSVFIKEMKRLPYDLAVSAQFNAHTDWELSERYGVEVVDEIYPENFNFAIVGEPGNVNSAGLRLAVKGETMTLEELSAAIEQNPADLDGLNALLDTAENPVEEALEAAVEVPTEVPAEPQTEEAVEQPEQPAEPETVEMNAVEEQEGTEQLSAEENTAEEPDALESALTAIQTANERITSLEAEVASLTAQLDAKKKSEQEFLDKFKNLSVALTKQKPKEIKKAGANYTDGFGR